MSFTIVVDNDLHFSILELAAILDMELKSEDHHYKSTFQQLLDENNNDEIINQLINVQSLFLTKFSRKSFEPSINTYLHIVSLIDSDNEHNLLSNLINNIDSTKNTETVIPNDVILVSLTNIFNLLSEISVIRFNALSTIVKIIINDNISGLIQNISKNIQKWLLPIDSQIETSLKSQLLIQIFTQHSIENEFESFNTFQQIILDNKLSLTSEFFNKFFSTLLNSTQIYNLTSLSESFKQVSSSTSLSKLLNIYLIGNYDEFISNKSEFESLSISLENLESNLLTLTILNYLAKSSTNTLSYTTISNDLKISIDTIELKLFDLISQNLINGKLSQSTNSIIVNSINFTGPSLSANKELVNWSEINELLSNWNNNINNLQSIVQSLIQKRGKRVNAPDVIMNFHKQKLDAKEAREKKALQQDNVDESSNTEIETEIEA